MKKLLLPVLALVIFSAANAQDAKNTNRNFYEIRKKFLAEYEQLEKQKKVEKEEKDGDGLMQQFRRWEYIAQGRLLPGGYLPTEDMNWKAWEEYQSTHADQFALVPQRTVWTQVGASVVPSLGGGAGRVNVIRFDPLSTDIMYIGTAGGGVWKTTDGGTTWKPIGDQYPVTSIADIAIDPANGNNIFVATGDGAGYEFGQNDFWGGVYSAGIMRSTDGGATWGRVAKLEQTDKNIIQRLLFSSKDTALIMARRDAVYLSKNGGRTWTNVLAAHCYDMEFNTADSKIVYAGGEGKLYKSTDAGATWTTIRSGLSTGRMSIEVSASNPDVIYILTSSNFQKSTDGGATWTNKTYPSGASFYGYYDLVLGCAGANSDYLIAGGLNTVKSTNGGSSWTTVDNWSSYTAPNYVHADKHTAIFYPGSTTDILVGTDGGIFKTTNGGTNWSDLSNGLAIAQIYRLGTTPQNTDLVISGWQDNGCNKWDGTNWTRVYGADGMEAAIDYTNENTMYEEYQYGGLQRSTNGGTSWSYIAPSSGFWLTPFIIDPVNSSRLYYGAFGSLYKSDNKGTNWSTVKGVSIGDYIMAIAVAPSNNNIVYVAGNNRIMKADLTTNTATNITGTLPTTTSGINYIAVSDTDPNKVWVAMAGYTAGDKVFRTTDGGATWTNVSGTLPNIPVNTIVYHNGSSDRVFIGTDIGVFMIDDSLTDWVVYGKKLPNVMVHELEINYTSNELVAATYGRGIWQTHVPNRTPVAVAAGTKATPQLKANLYPNPTNGLVNISVEDAQGEVLVDVYKITGDKAASYRFNAAAAKNIRLDLSSQPFGNYIVRIQSGDAVTTKTIQLNK